MQKLLPLLLGLYAAVVSTLLLLGIAGGGEASAPTAASSDSDEIRVALRDTVSRARREAQRVAQANVQKQEERLARYDQLVRDMEESLKEVDSWIEELSRRNSGSMDEIVKDLEALRGLRGDFQKVKDSVSALALRVKSVEDRPPVIKEIIKSGTPAKPSQPDKPKVPTLPGETKEDPAKIQAKVAKALTDIQGKKLMVVWPAIETVRKYRVLQAGPRLIQILREFKDKFARQAAATALGEMQYADAVMPLADALKDDGDVAQMAAKAIFKITGFDPELSHSARPKERTRARNSVIAWWRGNEDAVRERLKQPKG